MSEEKRKEILAKGEIELHVKRTGIQQRLIFKIVRHATPLGLVPYITLDKFLDLSELMRISEEYSLPVHAKNGKVYPRGKREMDFIGL
ncbi:MAG: hypothetical protein NTV88_04550 [Candidatus Micrarchaeota archaeon]|nr:hypothetical protein [Candidatus Micrarchaeota archaeon]